MSLTEEVRSLAEIIGADFLGIADLAAAKDAIHAQGGETLRSKGIRRACR